MKPEAGTRPRVYYRNLWRYSKCFIGGTLSAEANGVVDCVEGASVRLLKDGRTVAETTSDNYGDFKFDKLDENSGAYVVEISAHGHGKKARRGKSRREHQSRRDQAVVRHSEPRTAAGIDPPACTGVGPRAGAPGSRGLLSMLYQSTPCLSGARRHLRDAGAMGGGGVARCRRAGARPARAAQHVRLLSQHRRAGRTI